MKDPNEKEDTPETETETETTETTHSEDWGKDDEDVIVSPTEG